MVPIAGGEQFSTSVVQLETGIEDSDEAVREAEPSQKKSAVPENLRSPRPQPAKSGLAFLSEDELPEWDALVESSPQCSVFVKSWWLKATCDKVRVLGFYEEGRLIAGIPLHYEYKAGLRICKLSKLTQTWGVVMAPFPGKKVTADSREMEILDAFAARLANERFFVQAFHPTSQNWLPFHWRGFTQTTHYTYVLDELESMDRLWNGLAQVRRTNIRKARKLGLIVKECSPEVVYQAAKATFDHQGKQCPYQIEYLRRLYDAARAHDAGVCLAAEDPGGQIHAAYFFAWDRKRGYLLAGGHDPSLGASGGSVLLVWHLIEFAAAHTAVFDFEGSMQKQIETSFRSYGATRVAYNRIVKIPRWLRIGLCAMGRQSV
ncbi:MAG: GNAT family N-acetyltransferase [Terracidiphilus sp.]